MNRRARLLGTAYPVLCLALLATAVAPLWLVEHPPLTDWFNLLSRLQLLSDPEHPAFSTYYRTEWRFLPALGLELIALPLTPLIGAAAAMKVTICLAFAALIAGTMALHYGFYRSVTPVTALAFLLLWSEVVHVGLIPYLVGVAFAVPGIAAWLLLASRPGLRLVVCTALGVPMLLAHLVAFAFFGLALAAIEAAAAWRAPAGERRAGRRLLHLAIVGGVPLACLLLFGPPFEAYRSPETTGSLGTMLAMLMHEYLLYFSRKGLYLWYIVGGDIVNGRPMELWARVAAMVAIALAVLALATARRMPHPGALLLLGASATLYLLMPLHVGGSSLVDWRLLIPMAFCAVAALPPAPQREPYRVLEVVTVIAVAALLALRAWDLHRTWQPAQRYVADFDAATAALPHGAKLYTYFMQVPWVGPQYRHETRFLNHIASRAVARDAALVPKQFTIPAAQALRFKPEYEFVRVPWEDIRQDEITVHWDDVLAYFDHVLVIKLSELPAPADVGMPEGGLELVGQAGMFRLFKVTGGGRG